MNKTGIMKAAVYYNSHVCRGHAGKKIYVASPIRTEISCKDETCASVFAFCAHTAMEMHPNVVWGTRKQTQRSSPCRPAHDSKERPSIKIKNT